jgi:hypothetical protein
VQPPPRPNLRKRRQVNNEEEGGLIGTFKGVGEILVDAIIKSATAASDMPPDFCMQPCRVFLALMSLMLMIIS